LRKVDGAGFGQLAAMLRVSESRRIFPLMDDRARAYFGDGGEEADQFGIIDSMRAVFGRSYAAEPDVLIEQLQKEEAIAEADTLLLTIPNHSACRNSSPRCEPVEGTLDRL
jgi:hypothetical protein